MPLYFSIPAYLVLAALIIYLSYKLGDYVDALDKKTKISGAFIGGILLAAVTSLPELFTSLSAIIFLNQTDMVVGNILGSNLFNFMVLGLSIVLFVRKYLKAPLEKSHIYSLLILIAQSAVTIYAVLGTHQPLLGPVNLLSVVILGLYIINLLIQPSSGESSDDEEDDSNNKTLQLSIKQIIVRFIICAVLLVGTSILLTLVTDELAESLNLSANIAGSLFLAIATSLPEVVSTLTLCKRGNFNAGYGNIVGSGIFNFIILVIAEFMSWNNSVFVNESSTTFTTESFLMAIFAIIVATATIGATLMIRKYQQKERSKTVNTVVTVASISLGTLIFGGYILFLVVNTSGFSLPF